jgi:hypothetical protein
MKLTASRPLYLFSVLALISASYSIASPVQAGPFDFLNGINSSINQVNGTVNGVRDVHSNATGTLNNLSSLGSLLGIGSSTPSTDLFEIYAKWYGSMPATEQEVVNVLITDFAEDKQLTFGGFKKSREYARLSPQAKSNASAIFFKFKEVSATALPVKDRFLAFAFCLSGGGKECK